MPGKTPNGIEYPLGSELVNFDVQIKNMADTTDAAMRRVAQDEAEAAGWFEGELPAGTDIDAVRSPGAYSVSRFANPKNVPVPGESGTLEVLALGQDWMMQRFTSQTGLVRQRTGGGVSTWTWNPWVDIGASSSVRRILPDGTDLDAVRSPGDWAVSRFANPVNVPIPGESGTLEILALGQDWMMQRFTSQSGQVRLRTGGGVSTWTWNPWTVGAGGSSGGMSGALTRTTAETTGEWMSVAAMREAVASLDTHAWVTTETIGKTAGGQDIPALVIGDPTLPKFLAVGGLHGAEKGNPHVLIAWARMLLEARDVMLMDMCVLIVPMLNIDGYVASTRGNANDVDLNRDWVNMSQPETKALRDWISGKNVVAAVDGHSFGYPRQVSLTAASLGTSAVQSRSQEMYQAVWSAVEADGNLVRDYAPGVSPGMLIDGMAALGIPAIFTEIPSQNPLTSERKPAPGWQVHIGALAFDAAAHTAWRWTDGYKTEHAPLLPAKPRTIADRLAAVEARGGSTGWRDVTSMLTVPVKSGRVMFRRDGGLCRLAFDTLIMQNAGSGGVMVLPTGYRPAFTEGNTMRGVSTIAQVTNIGNVQLHAWVADALIVGSVSWFTEQPAPANPIGT